MNTEIPNLHCKLKRYERKSKKKSEDGKVITSRRYMIPIKKDQIEGTEFENVENIIILSYDDFKKEIDKSKHMLSSYQGLKQSLQDKDRIIGDLQEKVKENNVNDLDKINEEFKLKLDNIVSEYEYKLNSLNDELDKYSEIEKQHNLLEIHNKQLNRELKKVNDLRELERSSFNNKLQQIQFISEEHEKLKKSHELLWDVVEQKEQKIKALEKRGLVNNIFGKIRK